MWKLPNCGDYIDFPKGVTGGGGEIGSAQPDLDLVCDIPPQHLPQCCIPGLHCTPAAAASSRALPGIPGLHCTPAAAASSRALPGAGSSCVDRGTVALPGFVLLICLGFLFRFDFRG